MGNLSKEKPRRLNLWRAQEDQFGIAQLIRDYMIPVETNSIWYLLGGVLAISLALEILTGILLSLVYAPDAGRAFAITAGRFISSGSYL
jgi:quinol-cytochrome oxidoreductase complex cytochrome b subunit